MSCTSNVSNGYYSAMVTAASNYGDDSNGAAQIAPYANTNRYIPHQSQFSTCLKRSPLNPSHLSPTLHQGGLFMGNNLTSASPSSSAKQTGVPSPISSPTSATFSKGRNGSVLVNGDGRPQNLSTLNASFSSSTSASVDGGKRYRHNPYGSEPNTPTVNPAPPPLQNHPSGSPRERNNSVNTSMDSTGSLTTTGHHHLSSAGTLAGGTLTSHEIPNNCCPTTSREPLHDSLTNGAQFHSIDVSSLSVIEQFNASVGTLAKSACTVRGRTILVGVIRQKNERFQIIYSEIGPNIGTLALDLNGWHVVRTLLDFTTPEQNQHMVEMLTDAQVLEMASNSQHSRRILQCLFEKFQSSSLDKVVRVLANEARSLSTTQQGCITVMRVVEHGLPHQRQMLLDALLPELARLTMDPYGNYVVQAVLDYMGASNVAEIIGDAYTGHWLDLSCNKYASNVMEKIIRTVTGSSRELLLQELVLTPDDACVSKLVSDGYGNFVIQAIIESATNNTEVKLLGDRLRPLLEYSPYAHRIEARLKAATGSGPAHQRHNNAQRNKACTVDKPYQGMRKQSMSERNHGSENESSGNYHERQRHSNHQNFESGAYHATSSSGSGASSQDGFDHRNISRRKGGRNNF